MTLSYLKICHCPLLLILMIRSYIFRVGFPIFLTILSTPESVVWQLPSTWPHSPLTSHFNDLHLYSSLYTISAIHTFPLLPIQSVRMTPVPNMMRMWHSPRHSHPILSYVPVSIKSVCSPIHNHSLYFPIKSSLSLASFPPQPGPSFSTMLLLTQNQIRVHNNIFYLTWGKLQLY